MTFPRKLLFAMRVGLGLAALATQAHAADAQKWEAISKTALSITGDITLSPDRIAMAGKSFPLQLVREIADPRQATALGNASMSHDSVRARIYRTSIPGTVVLENGNTLCGDAATWLVVFERKSSFAPLGLAVFRGAAEPTAATPEGQLCGTYFYDLPAPPAPPARR